MNRIVLARATLAAFTLAAAAAGVARPPPETVSLPSRNGEVRFPHRNHWAYVEGGCRACHAVGDTGRLSSTLPHLYGKDGGHAFCRGCHERRGQGPTMCSRCHEGSGAREAALQPPRRPDPDAPPEPWPPKLRPVRPDGPLDESVTAGSEAAAALPARPTATPTPTATSTPTPTPTPPPPARRLGDRVPTPGEAEAALIRDIEEQEARERADAAARSATGSSGPPGERR